MLRVCLTDAELIYETKRRSKAERGSKMSDESKITDPDFQPMSEESKSKGHLLSINSDLRALLAEAEAKVRELENRDKEANELIAANVKVQLGFVEKITELQTANAALEQKVKSLEEKLKGNNEKQ